MERCEIVKLRGERVWAVVHPEEAGLDDVRFTDRRYAVGYVKGYDVAMDAAEEATAEAICMANKVIREGVMRCAELGPAVDGLGEDEGARMTMVNDLGEEADSKGEDHWVDPWRVVWRSWAGGRELVWSETAAGALRYAVAVHAKEPLVYPQILGGE